MSRLTSIAQWHERINATIQGSATIYSSSGSTGPGKSLPYTPDVFRGAVKRTKEVCNLIPIRNTDKVVIMWGYGLFPPAQFYTQALGEMGALVYPLGSGKNLSTELKIIRMVDTPPSILVGMPSYLLKVGRDMIASGNLSKACVNLRCLITGGELLSEALRQELIKLFRAPVFDHYGMLQAPMIAGECSFQRKHISEEYDPEVLDGTKISSNGKGTLLLSSETVWPITLRRLQTNDRVRLCRNTCECGSDAPWIEIFGRTDFVMKIRGQQVDFTALCSNLRDITIAELYFEIIKEPTDRVVVHIGPSVDEAILRKALDSQLSFTYEVKTYSTLELPQTNTGKTTQIVIRST
ncbi:MAG TPA: hypothetical protein VFI74_00910 [Candidatus Saccharimonadales bacterium]|nr:hypothetical protein [Candidatus Saccharimonadales bacterium]